MRDPEAPKNLEPRWNPLCGSPIPVLDWKFKEKLQGRPAVETARSANSRCRAFYACASPRYGKINRTPNAAILGPKVMITNEFAGSGGDAMPYFFRQPKIGRWLGNGRR
jgi:hypothetical protein